MRVFRTLLFGSLALAGCFTEPPRPGSGSGCAVGAGAQVSTFDPPKQCQPFANDYGSGVDNVGGRLHVEQSETGVDGGCRNGTEFPLAPEGVFIEVPLVAAGDEQYTVFSIDDEGDRIIAADGSFSFESYLSGPYDAVPFDASSMRWWRMRPSPTTGRLVAEYSQDASAWTQFAESERDAPAMAQIGLQVGTGRDAVEPAPGEFDNLNVCPE